MTPPTAGYLLDCFFAVRTPAGKVEWVMQQLREGTISEREALWFLDLPATTSPGEPKRP